MRILRFRELGLKRSLIGISTISIASYYGYRHFYKPISIRKQKNKDNLVDPFSMTTFPSRSELISLIDKNKEFDVLIIGGGATGAGCALDSATRGLSTILLERNDFASETSSKSTKMAHGGIRYLENAILKLSKDQLDLVIEALDERSNLLNIAPHLSKILPIIIPIYSSWQLPYYYFGCKLYDLLAGSKNLKNSYLLSHYSTTKVAPMLDVPDLKASIVYHDGSFNDSRLNLSLALTSIKNGAIVLNYMNVTKLLKDSNNNDKLCGVEVKDKETGKKYLIKAKAIINATGPFSDSILQMDKNVDELPDESTNEKNDIITTPVYRDLFPKINNISINNPSLVIPSSGVHLILPSFYCPQNMGILDFKTSDGRVMFFLPWQNKVLAGTTDIPLKQVPENPIAKESDIEDILKELQNYIKFPVKRNDVLSAWAGIRPLVNSSKVLKETSESSGTSPTKGLVRSHILFTSKSGLITITGGKWTTYRRMAQDTIDEVVKQNGFNAKPCITKKLRIIGSENWTPNTVALLSQKYNLSQKMATYLSENYGTRSSLICQLFEEDKFNELPVYLAGREQKPVLQVLNMKSMRYPYTIGELKYCIKNEYTRTALDFLMRRTRFGFLDAKEALNSVEGTVNIMGDELNWDQERRNLEVEYSKRFIKSYGI